MLCLLRAPDDPQGRGGVEEVARRAEERPLQKHNTVAHFGRLRLLPQDKKKTVFPL